MICIFLALLIGSDIEPVGPKVVVSQTDETKFPEITVYFEVRKPDGSFIRDAGRGEFRLTEDGRDRPIEAFEAPISTVSKSTTIVLVIDRSGSMREDGKMVALRRAVGTFLKELPEGSRVAVVAFGSDVRRVCPFTTDRDQVRQAIDGLEPFGATRYYDAVIAAIGLLDREPGRRAVLAMTDGQDTDSERTIDEAIAEGRRLAIPVHTLGLGAGGSIDTEALERLAEGTRGQSYRANDAASLRAIYQELAERLGSSYRLTYRTDRNVADGTLRPIRVTYAEGVGAGEASIFIPGMVVRQAGWSWLFLALIMGLSGLALLPALIGKIREGLFKV